jgi:HAD superfamily hydrolase (TIGR01509 family)
MSSFYDAVFFDMDGLFVDSEPLWLEAEAELMSDFNYQWTQQDQNYCLGGPLTRVGQYMFEKSGNFESPQFFTQAIINRMEIKLSSGAPVMPGASDLLTDLAAHGVKTALVSASPRVLVDAVLKSLPSHSFAFSLSADDVQFPKPSPEAYLKAALMFAVDIKNCLIFEDSPTGVQAATQSGAYVVAVPHLVHIEQSNRLTVIKSLKEISFQNLLSNYGQDKSI